MVDLDEVVSALCALLADEVVLTAAVVVALAGVAHSAVGVVPLLAAV